MTLTLPIRTPNRRSDLINCWVIRELDKVDWQSNCPFSIVWYCKDIPELDGFDYRIEGEIKDYGYRKDVDSDDFWHPMYPKAPYAIPKSQLDVHEFGDGTANIWVEVRFRVVVNDPTEVYPFYSEWGEYTFNARDAMTFQEFCDDLEMWYPLVHGVEGDPTWQDIWATFNPDNIPTAAIAKSACIRCNRMFKGESRDETNQLWASRTMQCNENPDKCDQLDAELIRLNVDFTEIYGQASLSDRTYELIVAHSEAGETMTQEEADSRREKAQRKADEINARQARLHAEQLENERETRERLARLEQAEQARNQKPVETPKEKPYVYGEYLQDAQEKAEEDGNMLHWMAIQAEVDLMYMGYGKARYPNVVTVAVIDEIDATYAGVRLDRLRNELNGDIPDEYK